VTGTCSDKMGTLTQGKMVARGVWTPSPGTYIYGRELKRGLNPDCWRLPVRRAPTNGHQLQDRKEEAHSSGSTVSTGTTAR
jgi:magnesium-transporting ATPase (P-type)